MRDHIKFILQNSIIFAVVSFVFSIIGGLFPSSEHTFVIGNPLVVSGITVEHVVGHIFWGAIIGLGTLSIRYIILGGSFAILLDADHLLQFLDIELVSRMSHSVALAVIVAIVFFIVLRGKDLRIAAVAFGAVLSHIAFDIFLADVGFNSAFCAIKLATQIQLIWFKSGLFASSPARTFATSAWSCVFIHSS